MRKKWMTTFGAITDDPIALMAIANSELGNAKTPIDVRQAAEKAHLAMSSAVEVATRATINSADEERLGVLAISRWLRDPQVVEDFKKLRSAFHGKRFHGDKCPTAFALSNDFGKAEALIERMLRARKRHKK